MRERIELSASPLPRECSTTELPRLSPERFLIFRSAGVCRIAPVPRQGRARNPSTPGIAAVCPERMKNVSERLIEGIHAKLIGGIALATFIFPLITGMLIYLLTKSA